MERLAVSLELGRLDGRVELRELLGQGGMGEVYAAWDRSLQRAVAVKFVRGSDPRDAERLLLEASDGLSGLAGPCTVSVTGEPGRTGAFTVTAASADVAGNAATVTARYQVVCRGDDDNETRGSDDRMRNSRSLRNRTGECEDDHRKHKEHRDRPSPHRPGKSEDDHRKHEEPGSNGVRAAHPDRTRKSSASLLPPLHVFLAVAR